MSPVPSDATTTLQPFVGLPEPGLLAITNEVITTRGANAAVRLCMAQIVCDIHIMKETAVTYMSWEEAPV